MKIAVASGKGGTGKTTVAVNLYHYFNKYFSKNVQLIDCDVEEPNDLIFFPESVLKEKKDVFRSIPEIDIDSCTFCRKCTDWCEFNAIVIIPGKKFAEVDSNLCHSCGACNIACNYNAINENPEHLGTIQFYDTKNGRRLIEGRLKIGSAMQTALIKELKNEVSENNRLTIFDAPPGTSCPVVETIADADFIILVTEPTPFGLYDLQITVDLIKEIKIPFAVIINKAGLGDNKIYTYLNKNKIELLGEIPFSKEYASKYASGTILDNIPKKWELIYHDLVKKLDAKFQL